MFCVYGGLKGATIEGLKGAPVSPRRGDDLVSARQIGEAAVLWNEVHAVGASGAGKGEILQERHQEDEKLHTSQRLANTGSLSCEEKQLETLLGVYY